MHGIKSGLNEAFVISETTRNRIIAGSKQTADAKVFRGIVSGLNEAFVISRARRKSIISGNKRQPRSSAHFCKVAVSAVMPSSRAMSF